MIAVITACLPKVLFAEDHSLQGTGNSYSPLPSSVPRPPGDALPGLGKVLWKVKGTFESSKHAEGLRLQG